MSISTTTESRFIISNNNNWDYWAQLTAPIVPYNMVHKWAQSIKECKPLPTGPITLIMTNYEAFELAQAYLKDVSHVTTVYYFHHPLISNNAPVTTIKKGAQCDRHFIQALAQAAVLAGDWETCYHYQDSYYNATNERIIVAPFICIEKAFLPGLLKFQIKLCKENWVVDAGMFIDSLEYMFPFNDLTPTDIEMIGKCFDNFAKTDERGTVYVDMWKRLTQ